MLGWKAHEVIGKKISSLIVPSYLRGERYLILHEIMQNKAVKVLDTIRLHRNGTEKNVSIMVIPLLDINQDIIGFSCIIRNQRYAIEKLLESEKKYRTLIEHIQDGVFIIQHAKIRFANEAFAKMVGYTVEEIIGMDIRELIAPEDREMVEKRYYQRLAGKDVPKEYQFRVLHKNGSRILCEYEYRTHKLSWKTGKYGHS